MAQVKILVILDNPTHKSVKLHNVFLMGLEKVLFEACIQSEGIALEDIWFENVVDKPMLGEKHIGATVKEYAEDFIARVNSIRPAKILSFGVYGHAILIGQIHKTSGNKMPVLKKIRGAMYHYVLDDGTEIPMVSTVPPYMCLDEESYWIRDFSKDVAKLVNQAKRQEYPQMKIYVCNNTVQLKKGLDLLAKSSIVAVDIESTGFSHIQDTMQAFGLGSSSADGSTATAVILSRTLLHTADGAELDKARRLIHDFLMGVTFKNTLVMHNGKFDLKFINKWLKLPQPMYNPKIRDTLLLNHLLDERPLNDKTAPHGLKRIARERFDADDYSMDHDAFWALPEEKRDWKAYHLYLALDLYYTARLYRVQVKEMKQFCPEAIKVYNQVLCPASSALSIIESEGIPADPVSFKNLETTLQLELDQIKTAMQSLVHDVNPGFVKEFNPQSSMQVNDFLYDVCKLPMIKNKRTSGADALDAIIHVHRTKISAQTMSFIELLQDYRKMAKTVSTYARPLAERAVMGVVYAQFNQAGTSTGRMSSQDPNMQNMPNMAGPDIRRGFAAPEGWLWVKVDHSQLELRTAAEESNDPQMLKAFEEDRDIHVEVAIAMFGAAAWNNSDAKNRKAMRFAAKFFDFGVIYGRGAKSLAEGKELREYNWTLRDAQRFMDNFLGEFKGLTKWMKKTQVAAIENQELVSLMGRRRRWPLMSPEIKYRVEKQAVNFPVQSLASDITQYALVKIFEFLYNHSHLQARIVATVHDEIDLIVHHSCLDEVVSACLSIMENDPPIKLKVKLKAEADVGRNWTDLTPWQAGIKFDFIEERLAF